MNLQNAHRNFERVMSKYGASIAQMEAIGSRLDAIVDALSTKYKSKSRHSDLPASSGGKSRKNR